MIGRDKHERRAADLAHRLGYHMRMMKVGGERRFELRDRKTGALIAGRGFSLTADDVVRKCEEGGG